MATDLSGRQTLAEICISLWQKCLIVLVPEQGQNGDEPEVKLKRKIFVIFLTIVRHWLRRSWVASRVSNLIILIQYFFENGHLFTVSFFQTTIL